ncbi:MAG: hypothetical protein IT318_21110 [Anaerolineales bacterium]|nr:hypothetical protein [Anaerolineales bacterium]
MDRTSSARLKGRATRWARYGRLAAALGLGGLAAAPLLANSGFLLTRGGGDSPFLLLRLQQLLAALGGGQFPARWMPDADYGYGYPFFHYYAALPYYLAALLRVYGFSYTGALKLTQLAALCTAAGGAYLWARGMRSGAAPAGYSQPQAWLAAAAFTFAPFHLANLYVRGDSLSELWAMSLYPLLLWAAQRCRQRPSLGRAALLASFTGLLTLTHNISALNFIPFAALYFLLGWPAAQQTARAGLSRGRGPWPVAVGALALAWGLALAAFFWLPALTEIGAVQIGDVTQGYFFYGNHFRGADLVQRSLFYNAETGPGLPTPFSMGLAQAVLTGLGLLVLALRAGRARRWTSDDTFVLLGLLVSTLMITPASAWAWANLPLVRFTQFPWRFLSIQALFAAGLAAHVLPAGASRGAAGWTRNKPWLLALGLGLGLALFGLGRLRPEFVPLADADVTSERLNLLEYFSANIGSTIGYEYLPSMVRPRPFAAETLLDRPARLKVLSGQASGARLWQRGAREAWRVEVTSGPARVAVPRHAWPGWRISVDGQPAAPRVVESLGWIAVDLDMGSHTVELWLGSTPVRAAAMALSLAAAAGPAAYALHRRRRAIAVPRPIASRKTLLISAGAVGLAAAGALALHTRQPAPSTLPLSIDFVQLTNWQRDVVRFAGGAELVEVTYDADHLARGETLRVTSIWQHAAGRQATLRLVPASNLLSQAPVVLAADTAALAGEAGQVTQALTIPEEIPPGVYFVTVALAGPDGPLAAVTAAGRERGQVHLAPVWVDDAGPKPPAAGETALARFGPAITLWKAGATTPSADALHVSLTWQALADIAGNHQVALRLRDAAGAEWGSLDAQLAYGFYPTHFWRPGEVVPDFYTLALPAGTPPGDYQVELNLYTAPGLTSLGTTTFPALLSKATPRGDRLAQHALTEDVQLGAVRLPAQFDQGAAPEFQAEWLTTAAPGRAYRARWTLAGPDGARMTQVLALAPGSPSGGWPANAFVLGRARFGTPASLAPGQYAVSLALVNEAGQPQSAEVVVGTVEVVGRPRSFEVPRLQTPVGAVFGQALVLHGYDAVQTEDSLELTLAWGALTAPGRDYKFFVHLFNQADGFVAKQVDAMPRDFAYPTALWVAGEVVTDTVSFDLSDLAPGQYGVAVGWYDPSSTNLDRLAAVDARGEPLPDNRVVLPLGVDKP